MRAAERAVVRAEEEDDGQREARRLRPQPPRERDQLTLSLAFAEGKEDCGRRDFRGA